MRYGVSLSIKQCRNFSVDSIALIKETVQDLGITRFRLMSYWDEHEKVQGTYDFSALDEQVSAISKLGGSITLCLGARQPRWPESHWPSWTTDISKEDRKEALLKFIRTVVNRYKRNRSVVSWQLENEALLKSFGEHGDFDRARLRAEFALVKQLDPSRPVIMTTSTSWGIPFRRPIPDIVGFSLYRITFDKGAYRKSIYQPWIFKLRAWLIRLFWRRPSFIHELQAEPWGPNNIWEMSDTEQAKSMSVSILKDNLRAAQATGLYPIDLWGLEWWFSNKQHGHSEQWDTVRRLISYNKTNEEEN